MKELSIEDMVRQNLAKMTDLELQELLNYIEWLRQVKENKLKLFDYEVKAMFNRYNAVFNGMEYGYFCDACRTKVYKDFQKIPKQIEYEKERRTRETG
jgi:hypothetical protein